MDAEKLDEKILLELQLELRWMPGVDPRNVTVKALVEAGVATLFGHVTDPSIRRLAETSARGSIRRQRDQTTPSRGRSPARRRPRPRGPRSTRPRTAESRLTADDRFPEGITMKKLVVFDLDGTLAQSKSSFDEEMAKLFDRLLGVAVLPET